MNRKTDTIERLLQNEISYLRLAKRALLMRELLHAAELMKKANDERMKRVIRLEQLVAAMEKSK